MYRGEGFSRNGVWGKSKDMHLMVSTAQGLGLTKVPATEEISFYCCLRAQFDRRADDKQVEHKVLFKGV